MKPLSGITLRPQDLKAEGNTYTFFIQLQELLKKNGATGATPYDASFFKKYEYLTVTPEDDLKSPQNEKIDHIPGAFRAAQQIASGE